MPAEYGAMVSPEMRARRFLAGRALAGGGSVAGAMNAARREHAAMAAAQAEAGTGSRVAARIVGPEAVAPRLNPLNAAWHAVGPGQVASQSYGNVTGRVTSVVIDPADTSGNTVYIGTTGGGVWKSTNAAGPAGSVTFAPLTDTLPAFTPNAGTAALPSISIGALSAGPHVGGSILLAGTGDPNDSLDSYYGEGILRSADGGLTWTLVQQSFDGTGGNFSFTGLGIAGFAWSSTTQGLVVAAVSQALEGAVVNAPDNASSTMGLYYSLDAGVTWHMAVIQDGSAVVQTPLRLGTAGGGNAATSVVWNAVRQRFYAAVRFHGYYESVDGMTWTRLAHQPGTGLTLTACPTNPGFSGNVNCPMFRGTLTVQPVTGDTFALTTDGNNLDQGLWQDVCGLSGSACAATPIAFGTRLNSTPLEAGGSQAGGSTRIAQGDYDASLAAVATGSGATADTLLYVGTVDLYRCSLASGCALRNTTNALNGCAAPAMVAPAQHAIATMAGVGTGGLPLVVVGNDGGVWRSLDGVNQQQTPCSADDATHFQNLNSGLGSLAEVVSFAQHPTDAATLVAGLGPMGTAATGTAGSGSTAWPQITTGEGGVVAIDQANPQNWYVSAEEGVSVQYCAKGNACGAADFVGAPTLGYAQVSQDASAIAPPFLVDPALPSDMLVGTCRMWRGPAQSGASWPGSNTISTQLGRTIGGVCTGTAAMVRSIAAGGPASGAAAAQDAGSTVLYAGMAGFGDGGGSYAGHVFANYAAATAGGNTMWTDISMGPVTNAISTGGVFNPGGFDVSSVVADAHDATGKTVYATVMGFAGNGINAGHVYRSVDGGAHWTNISSNLPGSPANGLVVDPNDANTLYVAMDTGVYITTTVTNCTAADCWSVFGTGLPNSPVVGIAAAGAMATGDGRFGRLRVATYGRGIWEIPLLSAAYPPAPGMTLTPTSLAFTVQAVGTASAAQTVTVTNSGNALLTVTQLAATGDFVETDNCVGTPISAGASCTAQVKFLPTVMGTRTGVLTVYGNSASGQATVSLTGAGAPPAAVVVSPLSVTYSTTTVGTASSAQNLTVSNTGGLPTTLGTPSVTGDFNITANTCGLTLGAGAACMVSVAFAPTAAGTRTGSFNMTDSAGTQMASLTGLGVLPAAIALSSPTVTYSTTTVGTVSSAQPITISNSGGVSATLQSPIVTGDFNIATSTCGPTLGAGASCTVSITFAPTASGTRSGSFSLTDSAGTQTATLSGAGVLPASVAVNPISLTYASTTVGATSAAQTLTISNTGGLAATLQPPGVTSDFHITTNTCGTTLGPGASCTVAVVFAPTAAGTRNGSFNLTNSVGTALALLNGVSVLPANIVLSPTSSTYSSTTVGAVSAPQNVTISNTGGLSATLQTPVVTGDFNVTGNACGPMLGPGAACTVAVAFAPTASGTRSGTFSLTDSVGVQTASLNGVGGLPASVVLSSNSVTYPSTTVGATSSAQTITISNAGGVTANLQAPALTGDFSMTVNTCGPTLGPGSACTVSIVFVPTASGTRAGTFSLRDNVGTALASLNGAGVLPATVGLNTPSLTYPSTAIGTVSSAQPITITNSGGVSATLQNPVVTGDFNLAGSTCGPTLGGGASCTVSITFAPTASGMRSGSFSLTDSAGTQTAALSGPGVLPASVALNPTSLTYASTAIGTASTAQTLTISNTGSLTATLQPPGVTGDFNITTNTCGTTLGPGASCTVAIGFAPTAAGTRNGSFNLTNSVGTAMASLSGVGALPAAIGLSSTSITYASTTIGTVSGPQSIMVSNTGGLSASIGTPVVKGDFLITTNGCGLSLAAGASCTVSIAFAPTAAGTETGSLSVTGSAGTQTASLSGVGLVPATIVLLPTSLIYSATNVGAVSAVQYITISNMGGVTATLQAPSVAGDFKITANTCGPTLAANVGCTVGVAFAPTASGTRSGSFSLTDSVGTQTASLTGAGLLPATDALAPLGLTFAAQPLNTASATQAVTLTNNGDTSLLLIAGVITSGDFTVVNACGNSLIAHSTCSLLVAFVPRSVGGLTGVLTVSDEYRTQTVVLNGVAVAPAGVSLSPTGGMTFAATGVGLAAAAQTMTLTNNGGLPLAIQSVGTTGDFTIVAGTNTCGSSLVAGSACTVQVVFAPLAGGTRTGSLTVVDSAVGSPQTLSLTGVGVDFTLAAAGSTTATIAAGGYAVYPLLLSSAAGTPGSVTFTCGPLPKHATCAVNPAAPGLGGTTVISVSVATSVAGAALHLPGLPKEGQMVWLAGLLPLGLMALRRKRLGAVAVMCGLMAVCGCSASRIIPLTSVSGTGGSAAPTPSGTYNLVVTGSSTGLTRSVDLTLVVQ